MLKRISIPIFRYDLETLRGDVLGGVTAAVVGLPVALAFGLAAGLGPAAGIYGAHFGRVLCGVVFGRTRSLISGPTGSMTVAMAVIVTAHADNIAEAFTIVIMAGLIQIMFGLLRIGRYVTYTPYSVISGFMTGVGVIIHPGADSAVPGSARGGGRADRDAAEYNGRGGALRRQRACDRCGGVGHIVILAHAI